MSALNEVGQPCAPLNGVYYRMEDDDVQKRFNNGFRMEILNDIGITSAWADISIRGGKEKERNRTSNNNINTNTGGQYRNPVAQGLHFPGFAYS